MQSSLSGITAAAIATILGIAAPAQDAKTIERAGKHYRIVFHTGDLPIAIAAVIVDAALAEVEAMWPILQKLVGADARELHVIHLYRDAMEYRAVAQEGSPFEFTIDGFTTKELVAHVRLTPALDPDLYVHIGLPQCTTEHLLRVAADQVIQPLVPEWDSTDWTRHVLVMGAVEQATNPEGKMGRNPSFDSRRMLLVNRRREGGALLLENLLNPDLQFRSHDSWHWTMSRMAILAEALADSSSRWGRKLIGKHKMPKAPAYDSDRRRVAVSSIVGKDWGKAEVRFAELMADKRPMWFVRQPLWMSKGDRFLLVGEKDRAASVMTVEDVPKGDYVFAGRLELGPGRDDAMRFTFGWDEKSLAAVLFNEGRAEICEWSALLSTWRERAVAEVGIAKNKAFDFRVEVDGEEIRVVVDGAQVCAWRHGGREVHQTLSIEVNDRIVWLENFSIAALVK